MLNTVGTTAICPDLANCSNAAMWAPDVFNLGLRSPTGFDELQQLT
jgi:hypothetical protein